MTRVTFTIKGRPVPWKRQRTNGKRRFAAPGQEAAKEAVRWAYKSAVAGKTFYDMSEQAVDMVVTAVFALPQNKRSWGERKMGGPHTHTPDADNIAKLVKDALNGLAYEDDKVVSTLTVRKIWSDHNRTDISLEYHPVNRGFGLAQTVDSAKKNTPPHTGKSGNLDASTPKRLTTQNIGGS